MRSQLTEYFSTPGNDSKLSESFANWIVEFYQHTLKSTGADTAWLCLRATLPSQDYQVTRWHKDCWYWKRSDPSEESYKVVYTIQGPQTLFANPTIEQLAKIAEIDTA